LIKLSSMLIVAATLTGCTDDDDDDVRGFLPADTVEWRADIVGIGRFAAIRGDAHVMSTIGVKSIMAGADIQFDAPFAVRPWHVHVGPCATDGAIVGRPASYPLLRTNRGGRGDVTVGLPGGIEPDGVYHVDVHASAAELQTIIACGDLSLIEL